ncbi:hypothetical protein FACS1894152_4650 [Bacilli bacterium]|nr:hypothetical protein FACS1894152_4650 [Bacilli bacterium]
MKSKSCVSGNSQRKNTIYRLAEERETKKRCKKALKYLKKRQFVQKKIEIIQIDPNIPPHTLHLKILPPLAKEFRKTFMKNLKDFFEKDGNFTVLLRKISDVLRKIGNMLKHLMGLLFAINIALINTVRELIIQNASRAPNKKSRGREEKTSNINTSESNPNNRKVVPNQERNGRNTDKRKTREPAGVINSPPISDSTPTPPIIGNTPPPAGSEKNRLLEGGFRVLNLTPKETIPNINAKYKNKPEEKYADYSNSTDTKLLDNASGNQKNKTKEDRKKSKKKLVVNDDGVISVDGNIAEGIELSGNPEPKKSKLNFRDFSMENNKKPKRTEFGITMLELKQMIAPDPSTEPTEHHKGTEQKRKKAQPATPQLA